jgi:hypothetical protein
MTRYQELPVGIVHQTWLQAWHEGYADARSGRSQLHNGGRPHLQWRTAVEDAAGRPREVVIVDADGRVVVSPPPGEGFSLDPDQADLLAAAIQTASNRARGRRLPNRRAV